MPAGSREPGPGGPRRPTLGVLVNPIAGMGGRVALKGTDGPDVLALAWARGAHPVAGERARRALIRIRDARCPAAVLTAPGAMGGDIAADAGLLAQSTGPGHDGETCAEDTRSAARAMAAARVDLLLFAGGDGTARDIYDAIGDSVPVLGIPTGVKMHSGLFATTPAAAGDISVAFLRDPGKAPLRDAEIADLDERNLAEGVLSKLYGRARVPRAASVLGAKASTVAAEAALEGVCAALAHGLAPGTIYLLGPGTTTGLILAELGLEGSLLGIDAVRDGRLIGCDLDEAALLDLTSDGRDVRLILGVVGGQGSLLGRGNQQLSARVVRRIGRDRITVVASQDKLVALDPAVLRVDTGDEDLDRELSGYVRVHIARRRTMIMKVTS